MSVLFRFLGHLADIVTRSSEDEVMITRLLEKSIRRTEAVDREALCILAGEKVCISCNWKFIHLTIIS